jgi:RNA polymerase sigma-70 factor (ECF subfamily)
VSQLIRALPPKLRDPFLLAAGGEHRYEDIAALLGIPIGTVKWRMSEARRVLRAKLQRMGFGEVK